MLHSLTLLHRACDSQADAALVVQSVEATAASGSFVYKASLEAEEQLLPSIEGYSIILPTMLSVMYGQGEWPEKSVSAKYSAQSHA